MNEILFLLILISLTILLTMIFGWPYLFLSISFGLGWIVRGSFDNE